MWDETRKITGLTNMRLTTQETLYSSTPFFLYKKDIIGHDTRSSKLHKSYVALCTLSLILCWQVMCSLLIKNTNYWWIYAYTWQFYFMFILWNTGILVLMFRLIILALIIHLSIATNWTVGLVPSFVVMGWWQVMHSWWVTIFSLNFLP